MIYQLKCTILSFVHFSSFECMFERKKKMTCLDHSSTICNLSSGDSWWKLKSIVWTVAFSFASKKLISIELHKRNVWSTTLTQHCNSSIDRHWWPYSIKCRACVHLNISYAGTLNNKCLAVNDWGILSKHRVSYVWHRVTNSVTHWSCVLPQPQHLVFRTSDYRSRIWSDKRNSVNSNTSLRSTTLIFQWRSFCRRFG